MGKGRLSSDYRLNTSVQHRQTYGQFFTPPALAKLMLQWVIQLHPKVILDPAFGLGVFYRQLLVLRKDNPTLSSQFFGYDIDSLILSYCQDIASDFSLTLFNADYLNADITGVDAIICNPPYMRFQKFSNRTSILAKLEMKLGYKLPGHSNLASLFLVKSLAELNPGGRLAFLMPFEFFNTGYGVPVKQSLVKNNLLKQIILIKNERDLFPDALTTICLLLCENNSRDELIKVSHIFTQRQLNQIEDLSQLDYRSRSVGQLPSQEKWSPLLESTPDRSRIPEGFDSLASYGTFKRGIATGANAFFVLKPSQIKELKLALDYCSPCITKSHQIQDLILTNDRFQGLVKSDQAVYCLNVVTTDPPEVKAYIKFGERCQFHQRYLTKRRHPWYKLETRQAAPLLIGVFHRGRFKVIRNLSDALNLTCFHGFYPNELGLNWLDHIFVYLISDFGQELVKLNQRQYGNGLDKFEPGDLNKSRVPNPEQLGSLESAAVARVLKLAYVDQPGAIALSNQLMNSICS
ncbi:MAG: Type I restriction-modification system methyltransferase subunit [Phormidium sp. OSCR]|nr:MAG: Type I restriction-modification system methyltransferase subunit [Phormidium sp. OSCR]